ncbi:MAG: DUF4276 family protein [Akkermansia sp.]
MCEDLSGEKMLNHLLPKVWGISSPITKSIHHYRGLGSLPQGETNAKSLKHQALLNDLPRVLRAYGKTFGNYPSSSPAILAVICDLDDRDHEQFLVELEACLHSCTPQPETFFILAIEEGEAWLLGDIRAIQQAYPQCKMNILKQYKNDSVCGTWEILADAIYPGGSQELKKKGYSLIGTFKSECAEKITPNMDVDKNQSPSFQKLLTFLREQLTN